MKKTSGGRIVYNDHPVTGNIPMSAAILDEPMPKRTDVPVKMDTEVVRKAKIVAAFRGQSLAEFLSNTLGEIVDSLIDEAYAKEKGGKATKPKPKGKEPK